MKNSYKIVAKFEYNNNKFFITLVNDSKLVLVKYNENKNISTEFSDEEYELLNIVYKSLLIDKKESVYIKDEKIGNTLYKIFYDAKSKNYFWDSINGANNEDDNRILNNKYNKMTCIYYLEDENSIDKIDELLKEALDKLDNIKVKEKENKDTIDEEELQEVKLDSEAQEEIEEVIEEKTITENEEIQQDETEEIVAEDEKEDDELLEDKIKKAMQDIKIKRTLENFQKTVSFHQGDATQDKNEKELTIRLRKINPEELDEENENSKKEDKLYISKYVKFKKKIIPILISSTMALTPIIDAIVLGAQGRKEEKVSKESSSNMNQFFEKFEREFHYDYSKIEQAIDSNDNLADEEKDYLKKYKIVFDQDHAYMDLELIESRLETLKINYNNEYESDETQNYSLLAGTYNEETNEITMNGANEFESVNKADLAHELFHVWQNGSQRYIMELINEGYKREKLREMKDSEILSEEDFSENIGEYSNFGNGYDQHMYIYYILASMIGEDAIKEYQYSCDDEVIVSKLCKIDKNFEPNIKKQNAYKLLRSIDDLRVWDEKKQEYTINPEAEEKCKKRLNYYYSQKNGINIEEDLNCVIHKMYYNDNTYKAIETTLTNTTDKSSLGVWKKILPKTYLSDDHPTALIIFNSSDDPVTIEITDELCEKYKQNYKKVSEQQKDNEMER